MAFLVLTAMLHLTISTHYCGGHVAASKISVSGKVASCGMECSDIELPLYGTYFSKHCCEDVVTTFVLDNNYTTTFSFVTEVFQNSFHVISSQEAVSVNFNIEKNPLFTDVSPPWALMSTDVDLSGICVFRI
jgi:hypothetical protein